MKPKTFYLLLIVCTISLFTAARQVEKKCDKQKCCKQAELRATGKLLQTGAEKAGSDHSPLNLCLFSK